MLCTGPVFHGLQKMNGSCVLALIKVSEASKAADFCGMNWYCLQYLGGVTYYFSYKEKRQKYQNYWQI